MKYFGILFLLLASCTIQTVAPVSPPLPAVATISKAAVVSEVGDDVAAMQTSVIVAPPAPVVVMTKLCCSAPMNPAGYSFEFQSSADRVTWQTIYQGPYPNGAAVRYCCSSTNQTLFFRAVANSTNLVMALTSS